ncbi:tetratricopeptide repeat-containing sensor histidine kinase [Pedobacter jeongneungensis]
MKKLIPLFIFCNCYILSALAQGNLLSKQLIEMKKAGLNHYRLHQTHAYIDTLNRISYLYFKENPDSSWFYADKAYKLAINDQYLYGQAKAKLNFSGNYYYKNNYDKAFIELYDAYKIATKTSDQALIAICLNDIGLAYVQQKNYPIALKHFYRALELSTKIKDYNTQMLNEFNLGFCYAILFGKYKKQAYFNNSFKHYQLAQAIAKNINNQTYFFTCYNRLGDLFILKQDYKKGIKYFETVLYNQKEVSDWELGATYTSMAKANIGLKKFDNAIKFAELGFSIAKKNKDQINIEKSLSLLAKAYQEKGNFKKAYEILDQKAHYATLASDEEAKKRVNELLIIQKNLENQYLTKEITAQEKNIHLNRLLIIISISFLSLVSILLAIVYLKSKQQSKLNRLLADNNIDILQQKDLIAQQNIELQNNDDYKNKLILVIGHDLRSPFATTLQATRFFKEGDFSKEELNLFIDDFQEKILSSLEMLNDLITWTKSNKSTRANRIPYKLSSVTDLVIKELAQTSLLKQISLNHYHSTINDIVLIDEKQVMVILRNLITNAIKFTKPKGNIEIFYSAETATNNIFLHIKDNGIGMDQKKAAKLFAVFGDEMSSRGTAGESGSGIGLSLVSDFARLNDIKIQMKTQENGGTEFILGFTLV